MKQKIYELIDLIGEICSDNIDIEHLKNELVSIDNKVDFNKNNINNIKKELKIKDYENIEQKEEDKIELKKQVSKYNKHKTELNDIKNKLESVNKNKNKIFDNMSLAKDNIKTYSNLLQNLTNKIVEQDIDKEVYQLIIEENEHKLDFWKNKEAEYNSKYNEITIEDSLLRSTKEDMENELYFIKIKKDNLEQKITNVNNYFNHEQKKFDQSVIIEKEKIIKDLENKKLEIQTHIIFLISEFKEFISKNKFYEANLKFNEIWVLVSNTAYVLNDDFEELKLIAKNMQKEYLTIQNNIKVNNYALIGAEEINDRIYMIDIILEENKQNVKNLKDIINNVNNKKSINLWNTIKSLKTSEEIKTSYDKDLNHLLEYTNVLNTYGINFLNKYAVSLIQEKEKIKETLNDNKFTVDETRKLSDIQRIKEIAENLKIVNKKLDSKKEFQVMKHEIELLLESLEFEDGLSSTSRKSYRVKKIVEINVIKPDKQDVKNAVETVDV